MLPRDVEESAGRLGDGYAWRRKDIQRAIQALQVGGLAIVGVEAWVVRRKADCAGNEPSSKRDNLDPAKAKVAMVLADPGDWVIYGAVATRDDGVLTCFSWDAKPRQKGELWAAYVVRAAAETLAWIEAADVESRVLPEFSDSVFYNVVFKADTDDTSRSVEA